MTSTEQAQELFRHCNMFELPMESGVAHEGNGVSRHAFVTTKRHVASGLRFAIYVEVPPGVSIGQHRHDVTNEEYYFILSGTGEMEVDGEVIPVKAGELVRNDPGGQHGLINTGDETIQMFVFELDVRDERP